MAEETDVVVVGAGPSGLAVGACLRERGIGFEILEQADAVGASWRRHYERLHLHTVKYFSALPGLRWPEGTPMYPSRAQMVDYLERYAARFRLVPRFGQAVTRAARVGEGWTVQTAGGEIRSRALVIASGYNRTPVVPSWPGQERFGGQVLHSSAYRNGAAFKGQRALVVGLGNSGGEIAIDLWEHGAEVSISVRSPMHVVPRDLFGIPTQIQTVALMGRLPPELADRISLRMLDRAVGDLSRYGLHRPAVGPATQIVREGRVPLIDIGTVALIKQGKIRVLPGPREITETGVVFSDGRELGFEVIVLATGYRAGLSDFLEEAWRYTDERGYPRWHGAPTSARGLFFLGYRNPLIGALNDISREAPRVAGHVAGLLGRS
ncbi:MAG TPA: NAD(P)/FAD-dependent oxidoreductase [Candidatus Nanopelagicales bacterium]|nr:NAD(P)/FAD-dependent oxidoreductase [Candidatus Nanopelagicales bacterium]